MAAFKTDESFLEKISIGAIGTQKVFEILKQTGHVPIELERGSMNYKIWKKIKIKRIRVPDILCVNNGIRIESRAKTKLEISMSHSTSDPERGWDFGKKDNDYVAIIVCSKCGETPVDWKADDHVQFISIKSMRDADKHGQTIYVKPKGAQEGFEARITWPSVIASSDGEIIELTESTIRYKTIEGRKKFVKLSKGRKSLHPLVNIGDKIFQNQIIAATLHVQQSIPNDKVNADFFLNNINSLNLSERYAATKALSHFREEKVIVALQRKVLDVNEHIYVKLEAAASLARLNNDAGYTFIRNCLQDNYVQNVLESVIVLAEIKTDTACQMLINVLNNEQLNPEIRAGAAWGLGEHQKKAALNSIVSSFSAFDEGIKIEAARALAKLTKKFTAEILDYFDQANSFEKQGVAWALSKSDSLTLDNLLNTLNDNDSKQWVSYIIGMQGEQKYVTEIEKIKNKDAEIYFAVTLLWKIMASWTYNLKEY